MVVAAAAAAEADIVDVAAAEVVYQQHDTLLAHAIASTRAAREATLNKLNPKLP